MGGGTSGASRAYVKGHRVRGLLVVLACAAVTTAIALTGVVRRAVSPPAPTAAIAVAPPRPAVEAPRASAPTADEEGERTESASTSAPARDRRAQSPLHAQRERLSPPTKPAATARPNATGSKQSPPSPTASARYLTTPPFRPAQQPDPARAGVGQAATVRGSAPVADREGEGSGGDAVPGRGLAPASGEDDGRAGGATGAAPRSMPEPAQLVPPRVITSAGTAYPVEAFRLTVRRQELGSSLAIEGAEGTVRVRALVRADGTSDSVEVAASSGSAILDRAATEAVRRWLFAPATRNGVPLDAYVTVTIRYVVR